MTCDCKSSSRYVAPQVIQAPDISSGERVIRPSTQRVLMSQGGALPGLQGAPVRRIIPSYIIDPTNPGLKVSKSDFETAGDEEQLRAALTVLRIASTMSDTKESLAKDGTTATTWHNTAAAHNPALGFHLRVGISEQERTTFQFDLATAGVQNESSGACNRSLSLISPNGCGGGIYVLFAYRNTSEGLNEGQIQGASQTSSGQVSLTNVSTTLTSFNGEITWLYPFSKAFYDLCRLFGV